MRSLTILYFVTIIGEANGPHQSHPHDEVCPRTAGKHAPCPFLWVQTLARTAESRTRHNSYTPTYLLVGGLCYKINYLEIINLVK